jgi:hypothetical protein
MAVAVAVRASTGAVAVNTSDVADSGGAGDALEVASPNASGPLHAASTQIGTIQIAVRRQTVHHTMR